MMMTYIATQDFGLEAGLGNVAGYSTVNKFGEALDCDNGIATDVWDGADGTTSTDVWVAPTTARTHDVTSASAADTSAGTGARTVRVYGLTGWGAAEVSEDITMNGVANVATANSYVIVHRMKCLTFGSGETNAGIITATAQTDATVTAAIQAGEGQTLMAIYGVPSTQTLCVTGVYATVVGLASPIVAGTMWVMENADQSDSGFVVKDRASFSQANPWKRVYGPPKCFAGPCIIKIQALSDTNNAQVEASFDAYLADN